MIKLIKHYTYRQSIGMTSNAEESSDYTLAKALWQSVGLTLDNHSSIIIKVPGYKEEQCYYWADNKLYKVKRLVAGDCHPSVPCAQEIWNQNSES